MTNELEKQFFDAFGVEPRLKTFAIKRDEQGDLTYPPIYEYPQITDTHYLKLICILSKSKAFYSNFYKIQDVNIEQLKEQVLTNCISKSIYFKHQVRTLFEEG